MLAIQTQQRALLWRDKVEVLSTEEKDSNAEVAGIYGENDAL